MSMITIKDYQWDDSILLGDDIIDTQHKSIFDVFEDLILSLKPDSENKEEQVQRCFDFLKEYVTDHLKYEEWFLRINRYPENDLLDHINQHDTLRTFVDELEEDLSSYQTQASYQAHLIIELMAWLKLHIKVTDRKAMEFIKTKSL